MSNFFMALQFNLIIFIFLHRKSLIPPTSESGSHSVCTATLTTYIKDNTFSLPEKMTTYMTVRENISIIIKN